MSRSKRKPYIPNSDGSKHWKRQSNRKIRRGDLLVADGNHYKKLNDIWDSPMEQKGCCWNVPQMYRK